MPPSSTWPVSRARRSRSTSSPPTAALPAWSVWDRPGRRPRPPSGEPAPRWLAHAPATRGWRCGCPTAWASTMARPARRWPRAWSSAATATPPSSRRLAPTTAVTAPPSWPGSTSWAAPRQRPRRHCSAAPPSPGPCAWPETSPTSRAVRSPPRPSPRRRQPSPARPDWSPRSGPRRRSRRGASGECSASTGAAACRRASSS